MKAMSRGVGWGTRSRVEPNGPRTRGGRVIAARTSLNMRSFGGGATAASGMVIDTPLSHAARRRLGAYGSGPETSSAARMIGRSSRGRSSPWARLAARWRRGRVPPGSAREAPAVGWAVQGRAGRGHSVRVVFGLVGEREGGGAGGGRDQRTPRLPDTRGAMTASTGSSGTAGRAPRPQGLGPWPELAPELPPYRQREQDREDRHRHQGEDGAGDLHDGDCPLSLTVLARAGRPGTRPGTVSGPRSGS